MVGYAPGLCPRGQPLVNDAKTFWDRMAGLQGGTFRRDVDAIFSTALTINAQVGGRVLAPWLIQVSPVAGYVLTHAQDVYLDFDTAMYSAFLSLDPSAFFTDVDGVLALYPNFLPFWENNSRIHLAVYPRKVGNGYLFVDGSKIHSQGGINVCTSGVRDAIESVLYKCLPSTPAIALEGLHAESGTGGVKIGFRTAWENATQSFAVERIDDPSNPSWVGPDLPPAGGSTPAEYQIIDPVGGAGSPYRLVEHQVDGPDLRYGSIEAGAAPNVVSAEIPSYNVDSLATEINSMGNPGTLYQPESFPGKYLILAPNTLASSFGSYANAWQQRGVDVSILPVTPGDTTGLPGFLQWAYTNGTRYLLLAGDANDAAWWDDPFRWVNGWRYPRVRPNGPHIPSQPERNLIPTFYTADTDSPNIAMSFYTPYYASDLPYADVDGDGLPDFRVGRLPVTTTDEVLAYTSKLIQYLNTSPPSNRRALQLTYAQNNGGIVGRDVAADADTIATTIPAAVNLTRYADTDSTLWTYAYRESLANSAVNQAPDYVTWIASGAQRDIYANYWRIDHGWSMSRLATVSPPNRFFLSFAFSCGMANFDQTENYTSCDSVGSGTAHCLGPITPIAERLLLNPQKGAITVVGPSRGTFQEGNKLLALEFQRQLLSSGSDVGTAFMLAQRSCIVRYPQYKNLFRSYNLLGDPLIGGSILTGVSTLPSVSKTSISRARPNPFNPRTTITIVVGSVGSVKVRVFDIQGRLVRTLLDAQRAPAGSRVLTWDGTTDRGGKAASGVYWVRMDAVGHSYQEKVVLLK